MPDDLVLISWNVEKKGLTGLESDDTSDLIAQSIAETVKEAGSLDAETPFVSYLLEIKGDETQVAQMCARLKASYKTVTGQDIEVVADSVGGSGYTSESIITMSRGVTVKNSTLDVETRIATAVQEDEAQAGIAFQNKTRARASRKRKATPEWLQPKPEHFRANVKEPGWFRNGVVSDIELGETELRVSAVHSPGPSHVKEFPQSVDAARDTAAENGSDLLLGDFNRDGEFAGEAFTDSLSPFGKGTTFSKKALKTGDLKLGPRKRDRVLVRNNPLSEWRFTTHEPIVKGRGFGEARLTDHAMICVGATPKSEREMRQPGEEAPRDDAVIDGGDAEVLKEVANNADGGSMSRMKEEDEDESFDSNPRTKRRKKMENPDDLGVFVNNTSATNAQRDVFGSVKKETDLLSAPSGTSDAGSNILSDPISNPASETQNLFDNPTPTGSDAGNPTDSDAGNLTDGEPVDDAEMDADEVITEVLEVALV